MISSVLKRYLRYRNDRLLKQYRVTAKPLTS